MRMERTWDCIYTNTAIWTLDNIGGAPYRSWFRVYHQFEITIRVAVKPWEDMV